MAHRGIREVPNRDGSPVPLPDLAMAHQFAIEPVPRKGGSGNLSVSENVRLAERTCVGSSLSS